MTTSVCSIAFNQKSDVVVVFYLGEGRGTFWEGAVLRGRHKGFFGEVGGGNNVVCLKSRTLLTFGGGGSKVLGGKVQSPESRVQSPESRVQGPVQLLGYAKI